MKTATACRFDIDGEMTIYTAADTKARLMPLLAQCPVLEIDLSKVSEMDSAGLQLLILAKRECAQRNGDLRLTGHSPAVLEILDLCNMMPYFGDPVVISSQAH
ncbi:MAG: STAS domain-containing protein [Sulfuriferula sp.]|nr:STAS domain-containing protein [Sulfuriferula sp.]